MKDSLGSAIVSSTMGITRELEVELPPVNRKLNGPLNVKSAREAMKNKKQISC